MSYTDDMRDFAQQIQHLVDSAVDSNDFRELNQTVQSAVDDARVVFRTRQDTYTRRQNMNPYSNHSRFRDPLTRNASSARGKGFQAQPVNATLIAKQQRADRLFTKHPSGEAGGIVMAVFGFTLATFFGVGFFLTMMTHVLLSGVVSLALPMVIMLLLVAGFIYMGVKGLGKRSQADRFKKYQKILDDRDFCEVSELASATGKTEAYVVKDLKDMIGKNMFLQGHMDKQEKTLIVTNEAYKQYVQAQKSYDARVASEKAAQMAKYEAELAQKQAEKAQEAKEETKYSKEVREMLDEGRRYVKHIRECNDAIPGEVISAKISKLEMIVSSIFSAVEEDPSLAPELHTFMNYYLPTTQKLLDVYREVDAEAVQGENIRQTKKEIEGTLDTINIAFENLLNSFYKETAIDVSTDISVLNTMMANEGLTEDELTKFKKENEQKEEQPQVMTLKF